ncbi:MAG: phospholipid carrier-dependent glycosyltransferase [Candidatus Pacebacteria bacterium]|nr:phospholipid carrier-dependent glycosyltransferase [Candidatus Paceibacterota bacterium]
MKQLLMLVTILIFALIVRLYHLGSPPQKYFDEVYHLPAAQLILHHDSRAFEWWHGPIDEQGNYFDWLHPPLAKYFQALSMQIWGESVWAARLSSVIFGVGVVGLTYLLAQALFQRTQVSLLAAGLVSLDGLLLVQSRIVMNDIQASFWLLASLWAYLQHQRSQHQQARFWLLVTGGLFGLGLATKWSGLLALVLILIWELGQKLQQKKYHQLPLVIFSLILTPLAVYLLIFLPMFWQGKNLAQWLELHQQIIWYQFHRDANHAYASQPWQWVLNLRPVWYWQGQAQAGYTANIYALGNPVLLLAGALAAVIWLFRVTKKTITHWFSNHYLFLWLSYLVVWLPWIFSPRILFFYHYTLAVPLLMIILAVSLSWLWQRVHSGAQSLVLTILALSLLSFVIFYPHWVGLTVSKNLAHAVYFVLPSWK